MFLLPKKLFLFLSFKFFGDYGRVYNLVKRYVMLDRPILSNSDMESFRDFRGKADVHFRERRRATEKMLNPKQWIERCLQNLRMD